MPKTTKLAKTPLKFVGDWLTQQTQVELQARFNRIYLAQDVALTETEAKSDDYQFQPGIEQLTQWQTQYKGTDTYPMTLALTMQIVGAPSKQLHQQMIDTIALDSWIWEMRGVSYAKSLVRSVEDPENEKATVPDVIKQFERYADDIERYLASEAPLNSRGRLIAYMADYYNQNGQHQQYQHYLDRYKSEFAQSKGFKEWIDYFEPKTQVKDAPKFAIADIDNKQVTYTKETFKDKVYLLDFWATWCSPCIKELPLLHKIYDQYKDKGFEILSLSADESKTDVSKLRQGKWKMPWKHSFLDDKEKMTEAYEVTGYPSAFLVDAKGQIIADGYAARGERLEKALAEYFASKKG